MHKRPLPKGHKNVTYQDHLELRYLRWDYIVRSENPEEKVLRSKEKIIDYMAGRIFRRNQYEFNFMGMDIDDVKNIARVHAVSYLGLYSIHSDEAKKKRYKKKFENFEVEMEQRDNKSLMYFLEQRLMDTAFVIRQYLKGEPGFSYYSVFKRVSGEEWPTDSELVLGASKFGWQIVPWNRFLKIRHHFQGAQPGFNKIIDGDIYRVAVPETQIVNSDILFSGNYEESDSIYTSDYHTPEFIMDSYQQEGVRVEKRNGKATISSKEDRMHNLVNKFKEKSPERRVLLLKRCISMMQNISKKSGKDFSKEVNIAKRLISKIKEDNAD